MLSLFYGTGKGKTCCAIGAAIRTASKDKKVLYVEFLAQEEPADRKALETMYITVMSAPVNLELISDTANDSKAQVSKVFRELFDTAVVTVLTRQYDMLVLDGVFDAISKGFLIDTEVYDFLSNAPDNLDVICTGLNYDEKFSPLFKYITELTNKTPEE
ncbi:MAG: cob(I)yrinic acid a,c-diamide adenosyltransferase [Ruminococcus sp.]|nr:cob(I)yrinic acid a,c-diamide adenosyltransferase [Ruminococcus sp.]